VVYPYPEAPQESHYLPSVASNAAGSIFLSPHHHLHYKHNYIIAALCIIYTKFIFHIIKVSENVLTLQT
jgi:hypothetical protein